MSRGFHTPPECQGQTIDVSYMCAGDVMLRRVYDQSTLDESFEMAIIEDDDWEWYNTYEQCNGAPPITGERWQPISTAKAVRIIEEWY